MWSCFGKSQDVKDLLEAPVRPSERFVFFFLLFGAPHGKWKFPGQGSDLSYILTYITAVATPDPLTQCAGLWMEPASQCCRDSTNPVVPQRELLNTLFF